MRAALSRRALLGLLPGAMLPWLESSARGASPVPRRLVVLQWTNGVLPSYWPAVPAPGSDYELGETLAPLARHRQEVLVLGGLGIPYGRAGHFSLPSLLTGARPTVRAGDAGVGNAISLDQYVAEALARRSPTPIRSLELGGVYLAQHPVFRAVSFRGPAVDGRPRENTPEIDPYRVWRRLFGESPSFAPDFARIREERRSLLDHLTRELGGLMAGLPAGDRGRLEAHLEATRHLEREIHALPGAAATTAAGCAPSAPPSGVDVRDNLGIERVVRLQLDLLALALRCDLTRVATVMLVNGANDTIGFPFLGPAFAGTADPESAFDHHGIAHLGGAKKAQVDRWWVSQLALFLDRLKATPEGGGSLLDGTLVLFANHMGDGALHNGAGIPWILAGGGGKAFRTGRYLVHAGWDPARPALHCPPINGVLVALANAMLADDGTTAPLATFGVPEHAGELPGLRG